MKRPLAVIGFSYLAALRVAFIFGVGHAAVLSLLFAAAGLITILFRRLRFGGMMPAVFFSASAAMIALTLFSTFIVVPGDSYFGQKGNISATLTDLPYEQNGRYYYKLRIDSTDIPGGNTGTGALVSSASKIDIEPFDTLCADVSFYDRPSDSYYNYCISRGIHLRGSIRSGSDHSVIRAGSRGPMYYVLKLKQRVIDNINSLLPQKDAALVRAMLLSDRSSIENSDIQSFRAAGVSHIIVVSGFHLSVFAALLSALLSLIIKNKTVVSLLCCAGIFMYMSLAGFSPSVIRAGIMLISVFLAAAAYRVSDQLNSLGLAALVICFINPYSSADVGFLLSFYATLGIIVFSPRMKSFISEKLQPAKPMENSALIKTRKVLAPVIDYFLSLLCVTVSAVLFTAPCSVMSFRSFALYSVLFNILICPAASLLICIAAFTAVLSLIPFISAAAVIPAFLCRLPAEYILAVSSLSSVLPFSLVRASHDYIPACMLLSVGISVLLVLLFNDKKRMVMISAAFTVIVFTAAAVITGIMDIGTEKLSVVDTGDGLSVVLQKNDGNTAVLFCGGDFGNNSVLSDYLDGSEIKTISYLLLTDKMYSDTGYCSRLLEKYDILTIHIYDPERFSEKIISDFDKAGNIINSSYRDAEPYALKLGDTDINVLRCYGCTAVKAEVSGNSFLILADKTDCGLIPEEWRICDYLIINGIPENTQLLDAGCVIISDSGENVGNDAKALDISCDNICATGGNGTICVKISDSGNSELRRESTWLS